jgi:hypothetical protein
MVSVSGALSIGATDPGADLAYGVALSAAANLTNVKFCPLLPGILFEATLGPAGQVIAASDKFTLYGLVVTSGVVAVDKTDTVATRVRVVELIDPVGTVDGRVLVEFMRTAVAD